MGNSQTAYESAGSTSNGSFKRHEREDDEAEAPLTSLTREQIEHKFVEIVVSAG